MPTALPLITTANTFLQWMIRDNDTANAVNEILFVGDFTKANGNVIVANGSVNAAAVNSNTISVSTNIFAGKANLTINVEFANVITTNILNANTANVSNLRVNDEFGYLKAHGSNGDVSSSATIPYADVSGGPNIPGDFAPQNPTATVGTSVVVGVANTYLRSDSAPALNVAISPTWTGTHTFANKIVGSIDLATVATNADNATIATTANTANVAIVANLALRSFAPVFNPVSGDNIAANTSSSNINGTILTSGAGTLSLGYKANGTMFSLIALGGSVGIQPFANVTLHVSGNSTPSGTVSIGAYGMATFYTYFANTTNCSMIVIGSVTATG